MNVGEIAHLLDVRLVDRVIFPPCCLSSSPVWRWIGRFLPVNRGDMVKALEEHELKMVMLAEAGGAAQSGKWLVASEMVAGRLTRFGNTSVL